MAFLDVQYYKDAVRYHTSNAARWTGGFAARQIMNIFSGGGAISLALKTHDAMAKGAGPWAAIAAQSWAYSFGAVSLVLGAGVNGYLNHREMDFHNKQLASAFRHEIGAKLGKNPELVTAVDLQVVAAQIPTFDEELKRQRRIMHLSTAAWTVGAVVSFAAVIGAVAFIGAGLFASVLIGLSIGYFTHQMTEDLVKTVGTHVMGVQERSPLDRIRSLEQNHHLGRRVTPEQVMGVYVAADPQLDLHIRKDPDLKKSFDRLPLAAKHRAILTHGKDLGIQEVTNAINENRISVRELAFRIHGEVSTAYPEPTLYQKVQEKLSVVKDGIERSRMAANRTWDGMVSRLSSPQADPAQDQAVAADAAAEKSWVRDLGLAPPVPMQDQLSAWSDRVTRQSQQPVDTTKIVH